MANAVTAAPFTKQAELEKELKIEFEATKKYVFQLVVENPEPERPVINMRTNRVVPHKKFKPYQNLILTSQIVWKGGRINLRYYDGCESIFVSEQPKEKDVIDQLCQQTKRRNFLEGKLTIEGYDKMLLLYLNICSWNAESPFRTSTANQIFICVNGEKMATKESDKLDKIEEAMKFAREASVNKMFIHANFLGIPTTDYDSGNDLTEKEIRTAYRKEASKNPAKFIESFGNKSLEIKYYINQAWEKGTINNKLNKNKAAWSNSGTEICDIYGLTSPEAICQRLFEFSQNEEGEEFKIQLTALNET